jgi:hypothetical protein
MLKRHAEELSVLGAGGDDSGEGEAEPVAERQPPTSEANADAGHQQNRKVKPSLVFVCLIL